MTVRINIVGGEKYRTGERGEKQDFDNPFDAALHLLSKCNEGQLRRLRSGKIGQLIREAKQPRLASPA